MKTTILKSALAILLLSSGLSAGNIFDLHAQHFSNSIDGEGEGAKYNLPRVYVSTALKYENGVYALTTFDAAQTMSVEIKIPPANWSVSFDMSYYLYYNTHPIRFTSDTGKSITLSFTANTITLNGVNIYYRANSILGREEMTGTISKNGNTVTCTIAGYVTKTITVSDFSRLKYVNVSLVHDSDGIAKDYLNGLNIGSN